MHTPVLSVCHQGVDSSGHNRMVISLGRIFPLLFPLSAGLWQMGCDQPQKCDKLWVRPASLLPCPLNEGCCVLLGQSCMGVQVPTELFAALPAGEHKLHLQCVMGHNSAFFYMLVRVPTLLCSHLPIVPVLVCGWELWLTRCQRCWFLPPLLTLESLPS